MEREGMKGCNSCYGYSALVGKHYVYTLMHPLVVQVTAQTDSEKETDWSFIDGAASLSEVLNMQQVFCN